MGLLNGMVDLKVKSRADMKKGLTFFYDVERKPGICN